MRVRAGHGVPYPAQTGGCGAALCLSGAAGQGCLASGAVCSLVPGAHNTQSTLEGTASCSLLGQSSHLSYEASVQCQAQSRTQVNAHAESRARGSQRTGSLFLRCQRLRLRFLRARDLAIRATGDLVGKHHPSQGCQRSRALDADFHFQSLQHR